ncbi:transcriptional regulator/sugar kinase [Rhizobium leguminosarum bv. trifolii WSM2297]|uniref:Transcriptional regulator/sugar kinase n=1 Tax=Rhizobium leguminosarum bv. trifolii WSM2297 TaxID=754762 RepID=J0W2T7_RHILT|nr:ROK family transcriptional regulator [Rhizobium leguminosarum]EJC80051.1 transcriptional regulator/sugar kinase [Rhizobium leguminosarum bv. trifolii WSM2297]
MAYFPEPLIGRNFLREGGGTVSSNERDLLKLIWRNPGLSRSEVTAHTDLTQQSVYRIIDQLEERGIVSFGSPKPGAGRGQPSPTLRLNGRHAYSCGISVNTDVIGICLMDISGNVLAESSVVLRERTMAEALALVREQLSEHQKANDLSEETFFGIGFAIAGFHVSGTRYNAPLPLHEWSLIELGPLLTEFFGKPVWVQNGAKTGTVAESMFGAGRYIKHFAYLSFNYGFGGGLVSNGELLHNGIGNAGEFSGIYDPEESKRRPALQYLIERLTQNGVDVPSISYMRKHFDPKWPGVAEWVDEVTPAYSRLINAIWAIFDPQAIVFGGQVPYLLAQMLIDRTEIYDRPRYGVPRPRPKLIITEISSDASAMGAAIAPFKSAYY